MAEVEQPNRLFQAPTLILAVFGLVGGIAPGSIAWLVEPAAGVLHPEAPGFHLVLWHGFGLPLLLSGGVLVAGYLLYRGRLLVERAQAALPSVPGSLEGYRASLDGLLYAAGRVTGVAQCGSLPVYLTVVSITLVAVPGIPLLMAIVEAGGVSIALSPPGLLPLLVAGLTIAAAVGVTRAKRRFPAILMLGGVGYGVGALFVVQGAPDVALTQFLIETLMLIIFVLVLRHLPINFARSRVREYAPIRAVVAGLVGAFVFLFSLVAVGARTIPSISGEYLARAIPEAKGRNVVNVILVDFRGLDTMGEITVLAVAGLGISALVMASRGQVRGRLVSTTRGSPHRSAAGTSTGSD